MAKNDRQIRKIISNQVRVETEKAKEALTVLEKKSKNGLSLKEIIEAKNLKKQIEKTEEYYKSDDFEEKGVALKPAPAKPEEPWPWIFEWVRSEAKWEWAKKAGRKKKGEKYPARLIEITPLLLTMEYVSGYSGKPEKVVLGVGNTGDFYAANYYIKTKILKKLTCR